MYFMPSKMDSSWSLTQVFLTFPAPLCPPCPDWTYWIANAWANRPGNTWGSSWCHSPDIAMHRQRSALQDRSTIPASSTQSWEAFELIPKTDLSASWPNPGRFAPLIPRLLISLGWWVLLKEKIYIKTRQTSKNLKIFS